MALYMGDEEWEFLPLDRDDLEAMAFPGGKDKPLFMGVEPEL